MKKVLIVYAMYGSGHKTVACNIYENLKSEKNIDVALLDITPYANNAGKLSVKLFDFVVKYRTEKLFTAGYELLDNKLISKLQRRISKLFYDNTQIRREIKKINPDLVVATHYYGATLLSHFNRECVTDAKIITVLTDYAPHSEWLSNHTKKDLFIVANDLMKNELVNFGVDKRKIKALGIPMQISKFHNLAPKDEIMKKYKLDLAKPVVLFFGGSTAGSLTYLEYFKTVIKEHFDANIIFISGKNEKLKEKATSYAKKKNAKNVTVLGFTTDVYNLMNISDFVITKPGGATVTECLAFNLPMILIPGLGGQEMYNIKFIKREGYGVFARRKGKLIKYIYDFSKPRILEKYNKNLKKSLKKDSGMLIGKEIKKVLKDGTI